jgi:hypothetical protein
VLTPSEVIRPLVVPQDGPTEEHTIEAPRRKRPVLVMLGLVLVMLLGGVAAFLIFGNVLDGDDPEQPVQDDKKVASATTKPVAAEKRPETPETPKGEELPDLVPDAGEPEPAATPPPETVKQESEAEAAATAQPEPPRKKKKRKKRHRRRRKRITRPTRQPEAATAEKPKPPPERVPEPAKPEAPKVAKVERGSLLIYSKPWTEVYIDGTLYGSTPTDGPIELKIGIHVVELRNPRHGIKHRQRVNILPGGKQTVRKSFRKGFLKVYVKPFGEVFVNGVSKGLTPLGKPIELYEGTHTLRVISSRTGKEKSQRVKIDPGKTTTVKLDLR